MAGRDVTGWGPRPLYEAGLAHVPGDRHRWAMIEGFPLEDNLVLTSYYRPPFARGSVRQDAAIDHWARGAHRAIRHPDTLADRHDATRCRAGTSRRRSWRVSSAASPSSSSSTSRPAAWTSAASSSSIAERSRCATPAPAILLVSAELDEVLELSDRIAVMYRGELVATLDGRTANREEVGLLMATGGREAGSERGLRRDATPARRHAAAVLAAWAARGRSSPSRRSRWRPCSSPSSSRA